MNEGILPAEIAVLVRMNAQLASIEEALTLDGEEPTRAGMIGAFCALLELVKIGLVGAQQDGQGAPIELVLREDAGDDFESLIRSSRSMDEDDPDEEDPPAEGAQGAGQESLSAETSASKSGVEGPGQGD